MQLWENPIMSVIIIIAASFQCKIFFSSVPETGIKAVQHEDLFCDWDYKVGNNKGEFYKQLKCFDLHV